MNNKVTLVFSNDGSIKQVFAWYLENIRDRFQSRVIFLLSPINEDFLQRQRSIWLRRCEFVSRYGDIFKILGNFEHGRPIDNASFHEVSRRLTELYCFEDQIYTDFLKLWEMMTAHAQAAGTEQFTENQRNNGNA